MLKYTIKRLISAIPTILVVSVLIFVLVRFIPGSPAQVMLPDDATPEEVAALEAQMGLDQPVPVQFVKWIGNAIRGDLGSPSITIPPSLTFWWTAWVPLCCWLPMP